MRPEISIIIPARNEEQVLGKTLDSVLHAVRTWQQSVADATGRAEIIVVDNGSTDCTAQLLQRYRDQHGVVFDSLDQLGAARARNHGRRLANGRILVFLDSDTHVTQETLIRIWAHFEESGVEAGITRLASLNRGFRATIWWTFWEHVRRLPLPRAKAMPALMFCTSTVFDEFGPFDENVAIGEEWPILAGLYRARPRQFVYDRTITALTSSRRMEQQVFGYTRTFVKYVWAILHRKGRIHYTDRIR